MNRDSYVTLKNTSRHEIYFRSENPQHSSGRHRLPSGQSCEVTIHEAFSLWQSLGFQNSIKRGLLTFTEGEGLADLHKHFGVDTTKKPMGVQIKEFVDAKNSKKILAMWNDLDKDGILELRDLVVQAEWMDSTLLAKLDEAIPGSTTAKEITEKATERMTKKK